MNSQPETLGFLGPRGTHSEEAAIYFESLAPEAERAELVPFPSILDCLEAVSQKKIDRALVPVENSLEGSINVTLDVLAQSRDLNITRELIWPVRNHLIAKCPLAAIKSVHSHPQPLSQCRRYLQQNLPAAAQVNEASTARAAEIVAHSSDAEGRAAIGTRRAAQIYNLNVVASDIQDNSGNSTRFYEVRHQDSPIKFPTAEGRALVICQIDGSKAGSLLTVLQEFADFGVNLTRIESRPARTFLGAYIFFFDLELENNNHDVLRRAAAAVAERSIWLKYLGEFPVRYAPIKE